jgi:hypothetical protein
MTRIPFIAYLGIAVVAGCTSEGLDSGETSCTYRGKSYPPGASIPAGDSCNTCSCASKGQISCTTMYCQPDAALPPANGDADASDLGMGSDLAPSPDAGGSPVEVAPAASCALPALLTFGWDGGDAIYEDTYALDPSAGMTITRTYSTVGPAVMHTCTPALPPCGAPGVVSVSTVDQDLAAADVQDAFSLNTPPVYGVDERSEDGQVWSITLAGELAGAGRIFVGEPCPSPVTNSCQPVPAGVQRLADDLKSLASAVEPTCTGL